MFNSQQHAHTLSPAPQGDLAEDETAELELRFQQQAARKMASAKSKDKDSLSLIDFKRSHNVEIRLKRLKMRSECLCVSVSVCPSDWLLCLFLHAPCSVSPRAHLTVCPGCRVWRQL